MGNWLHASGYYTMKTGRRLRDLDSRDLFEVGYALMLEMSLVDKELLDAREKFEGRIRDMVLEDETGIPTAVRKFAMADASLYTGGGEK